MFGAFRAVPLLLLLSSCTPRATDASLPQRAIDLCVGEYTRLSGRALEPGVDRAYVLVGDAKLAQLDILFTRGEVGTFGERSKSYEAHLYCGVLTRSTMKIHSLRRPLQNPLIDLPGAKQLTEIQPASELRESLYLRTDDGFRFVAEQPFDPDKIEVEQSGVRSTD
jgi:hypothetical protein